MTTDQYCWIEWQKLSEFSQIQLLQDETRR